jgi:hypothetical protein
MLREWSGRHGDLLVVLPGRRGDVISAATFTLDVTVHFLSMQCRFSSGMKPASRRTGPTVQRWLSISARCGVDFIRLWNVGDAAASPMTFEIPNDQQ